MTDAKNNSEWFKAQLQHSLDVFVWAVEQIPAERISSEPPSGDWPVQQQIHHLYTYEKLVLPFLQQWLPNANPASSETVVMMQHMWSEQKSHWYKKDAVHWLTEFQNLRKESLQLVKKFDEAAWCEEKETIFWGVKSLFWMYSKLLQHTLEHTDSVLKQVLFWDETIDE